MEGKSLAKKDKLPNQITGVVIEPDGEVREITTEDTLFALWDIIGGYVQLVSLVDGADLFCNEDGIRLKLLPNPKAQALVETRGSYPVKGHILGRALILGGVNHEGQSTDVPSWVMDYLS